MASNRGSRNCDCGHTFRLQDFVGKAMEIRQQPPFAPQLGCKLECPACNRLYFGWVVQRHTFWGNRGAEADAESFTFGGTVFPNSNRGRFVVRDNAGRITGETGTLDIDTAYYENFRDEPIPELIEKIRQGVAEPLRVYKGDGEEFIP